MNDVDSSREEQQVALSAFAAALSGEAYVLVEPPEIESQRCRDCEARMCIMWESAIQFET